MMHALRCVSCLSLQTGSSLQKVTTCAHKHVSLMQQASTICCSGISTLWTSGHLSSPHRGYGGNNTYGVDGFSNGGAQQDLRRFLQEIGTNPKEARFWLKHFQRAVDPHRPFAVIQVDHSIFQEPQMLDHLCSCLSFLHRNDMKCVVVHGQKIPDDSCVTAESVQNARYQLVCDSINLVRTLENYGAPTRVFFSGSSVLQGEPSSRNIFRGEVKQVDMKPIVELALDTGHIAVIQSIGESPSGQLLNLDVCQVTAALARVMTPIKVMYLNTEGGITDSQGEVVANIHLPVDLVSNVDKEWCTPPIRKKLEHVNALLSELPPHTSAVITSANTLLKELFTHNGSGTQFKMTEQILTYDNLDTIDQERLLELINRSFGKSLKPNFFESIKDRINTVYLSKGYNAAAIITNEPGTNIAYLDKFAVSTQSQGEGVSDMLWNKIRQDFKQLFWRSRGTNWINPWYFKKSEGSWSNGDWTIFWYGVTETSLASDLVAHALTLDQSFEIDEASIKIRHR